MSKKRDLTTIYTYELPASPVLDETAQCYALFQVMPDMKRVALAHVPVGALIWLSTTEDGLEYHYTGNQDWQGNMARWSGDLAAGYRPNPEPLSAYGQAIAALSRSICQLYHAETVLKQFLPEATLKSVLAGRAQCTVVSATQVGEMDPKTAQEVADQVSAAMATASRPKTAH